jgi:hypothetical protein
MPWVDQRFWRFFEKLKDHYAEASLVHHHGTSSSANYKLVKCVTSFSLNCSAIHPSTLALLPTIALSFFNVLSI